MVTGDHNQLAYPAQLFDQPLGLRLRRAIMHKISQNNESIRPVVAQQLLQFVGNVGHSPQRNEPAR